MKKYGVSYMSVLKKGMGSRFRFHDDRKKVVLFLHCFRATPGVFDELSDIMFDNGFSYYNVRLPGHGLRDEDAILRIKKNDWLFYTENILLDLLDNFEEVYLCGLSLGATMAFNLSVRYGDRIKRCALLSPLFKPRQFKANFAVFLQYFMKKLKPAKPETFSTVPSKLYDDFISYFPLQQGYYTLRIAAQNVRNITKAVPPTIAFLGLNDKDMHYEDQKIIMERNSNIEIFTLEKSLHQVTLDVEKDIVHSKVVDFFFDK